MKPLSLEREAISERRAPEARAVRKRVILRRSWYEQDSLGVSADKRRTLFKDQEHVSCLEAGQSLAQDLDIEEKQKSLRLISKP